MSKARPHKSGWGAAWAAVEPSRDDVRAIVTLHGLLLAVGVVGARRGLLLAVGVVVGALRGLLLA
eukprot:9744455-Alexandrium_andersonii.AAC.1